MFHLSDIKNYLRCKRYFYLINQELPTPRILSNLRSDISVVELIKQKFKVKKLFVGKPNDETTVFLDAMEDYEWFYKARLEVDNLRIKLPLIKKVDDKVFDVYFILLLPNPEAHEALIYGQSVKMLNDLGYRTREVFIVHLNPDYVRKSRFNIDQALVVSKHFYDEHHVPQERVSWWINKRLVDYTSTMEDMESCLNGELPDPQKPQYCARRPRCSYFGVCHPQHRNGIMKADTKAATVISQTLWGFGLCSL